MARHNETPTTSYQGCAISYEEHRNEWRTYISGSTESAPTLALLKKKIDKIIKPQQRQPAIYKGGGWNDLADKFVTITSFTEGGGQVWFVAEDKSRGKAGAYQFAPVTPENRKRVARRTAIKKEIEVLEAEAEKLGEAMGFIEVPKEVEA